jgi:hypothetical protein
MGSIVKDQNGDTCELASLAVGVNGDGSTARSENGSDLGRLIDWAT